jgi:hypothetical protein
MKIAAAIVAEPSLRLEITGEFECQPSLGTWCEIGGAPDQTWNFCDGTLSTFPSVAPALITGNSVLISVICWAKSGYCMISGEKLFPFLAQFNTSPTHICREVLDSRRDHEGLVRRKAEKFLGQTNFFGSKRFAMCDRRVLFVRSTIPYMTMNNDYRRTISGRLAFSVGALNHAKVVRVGDAYDLPTIAQKARSDAFGKGNVGMAFRW